MLDVMDPDVLIYHCQPQANLAYNLTSFMVAGDGSSHSVVFYHLQ